MGILLAIVCIIACISCLLLRRRCLKRRALARARLLNSNNYYRPPITTGHETSLGVQLETSCSTEAHEMQQLMTEECPRHIPQSTTTHLDTKVIINSLILEIVRESLTNFVALTVSKILMLSNLIFKKIIFLQGGATFPNGQINGAVKSFQNGSLANGDIRITENPQVIKLKPILRYVLHVFNSFACTIPTRCPLNVTV